MRFAEPWWLLGALSSLLVLGFYVLGGLGLVRAFNRFGDRSRIESLLTARAGGMRALKGALVVISVALAFIALAGPQYGRGTRLIPATNLDTVIVLDYSKSMYARDVKPNRSERAKAEVARLIEDLPGARFGAVAFAGEPISFPLTGDGAAIAQSFRQTTPNDMPIGGTAIARALEAARELLQRDPLSENHEKVIVLVTDGEDLEGDPVAVAKAATKDGISIHVVQIGTRSAEVIPEVNELGQVTGVRRDSSGQPLVTTLSAQGEEQLAQIAKVSSGSIVRAEKGQTGIVEIAKRLKKLMSEELSEKVETLYDDVFHYPLALALLLLFIESLLPASRKKRPARTSSTLARTGTLAALVLLAWTQLGCQKLEKRIFQRHSPVVDRAIRAIESRDAGDATSLLTTYLNTGQCEDGALGTPESVRELPNASLDLGLALFQLAERYGQKFGELPNESQMDQAQLAKRSSEIDCALRVVRVIAANDELPLKLRAQAYYLSGNLEFLRYDYELAVDSYDSALRLLPGGEPDAGSQVGDSAAYNRAIALRRIQDEEEDEPDHPPDAGPPPGDAGGRDQQDDEQQDDEQQDEQQQDEQQEQEGDQEQDDEQQQQEQPNEQQEDQQQEQQEQAQQGQEQQQQEQQQQPQARPPLGQDERILDQLERAPMLQHAEKSDSRVRVRPTMEDK